METEQQRRINDERDQMASSRIALGKRHFDEKHKLRQNIINRCCGDDDVDEQLNERSAREQERRIGGEEAGK